MTARVRDVLAVVGLLLTNVGLLLLSWPSVLVFDGLLCIAVAVASTPRLRRP